MCMFVVLPVLVDTVLKQMRHTGSLRLSGSPRSFGLNPKCSHTAAVAFGFETNSMSQLASRLFALLCSRLKHSRLPTQSPCDWQAPPPHTKDNATDKRVHFSYAKETRVVIQSRITNKYANEIIAAGKIIEVIFFIVRLIDLSTIATGLFIIYYIFRWLIFSLLCSDCLCNIIEYNPF